VERERYRNNQITPIGVTDFRNIRQPFGIKDKDRLGHIYVIGKTGVGKSTLLESMAISDIERGNGMALLDPHGDLCEHILQYIPAHRINDVLYFTPADYFIPFNPLANIRPDQRHLAASGLIATFKNFWGESWGPRLEHILRYCLLTLLECEGTLLDIQPLLTNPIYRSNMLGRITSDHLLAFWAYEFEKYSPALKAEATASILNKLSLFQASDPLRNTVGHQVSGFQMPKVLQEGAIFIANLSKGRLGEDASSLLGSMLINAIQLAALARANIAIEKRRPFYLYIDECQSYLTGAISTILSESRKFGLGLFMANQYTEQLSDEMCAAIFGNVGTLIAFRVGATDAELLAKEFYPVFNETDLVHLPKYSMYLKLMIDGATSKPFSATTVPLPPVSHTFKVSVIESSRKKYGREKLADQVNEFHEHKTLAEGGSAARLFE
jgi:hypothetical protein